MRAFQPSSFAVSAPEILWTPTFSQTPLVRDQLYTMLSIAQDDAVALDAVAADDQDAPVLEQRHDRRLLCARASGRGAADRAGAGDRRRHRLRAPDLRPDPVVVLHDLAEG